MLKIEEPCSVAEPSVATKPVPVYDSGGIRLYQGDSHAITLALDETHDLLLTDPPYGIGADVAASKNKGKWGWKYHGESNWDSSRPTKEHIHALAACCEHQVIWGGNYFADFLPASQCWFIWNKMQRGFSLADGEVAWTSFDNALRICDLSRGSAIADFKEHATQKPLKLMTWCLAAAERNFGRKIETVFDGFAGTGTTLLAAKMMGKRAVGIEREPKYIEIAIRRLSQEELPLSAEPTEQPPVETMLL